MAKPEPFYYADRRLELPAPDMGTVQFEANVVAEIYHGVKALLSRSINVELLDRMQRIQEDCKRQVDGANQRWQTQYEVLVSRNNYVTDENDRLKAVIRKLTDTGVTSVEHLQAWGELQEILGDLS